MSTEEGVWIQFHCCEGYYPINNDQKTVSSQCLNSSWLPDPQTLVCEPIAKGKYGVYIHICDNLYFADAIDCGAPLFNGDDINFTSTTLGSIATYQMFVLLSVLVTEYGGQNQISPVSIVGEVHDNDCMHTYIHNSMCVLHFATYPCFILVILGLCTI